MTQYFIRNGLIAVGKLKNILHVLCWTIRSGSRGFGKVDKYWRSVQRSINFGSFGQIKGNVATTLVPK